VKLHHRAHVADRLRSPANLGTFARGLTIMKMPDAAERKVLIITTFVSACIAFAPQEWVSAITLLVASGLMYAYDRRLIAREKAASPTPKIAIEEPVAAPTESAELPDSTAALAADAALRAESAAPPPAP
jgi:hypothetical protein